MTVRTRLVTALFIMLSALFAAQAQAQMAIIPTTSTAAQQAYDAIVSGGNTTNAATSASLIQAARNAGVTEAQIAGALQQSGLNTQQIANAMLGNSTDVTRAQEVAQAIINSQDLNGTATGTTDATTVNTAVQSTLRASGVTDQAILSTVQVTARTSGNASVVGGATPGGVFGTTNTSSISSNVFGNNLRTLSPSGAGQSSTGISGSYGSFGASSSSGSGGPSLGSTAVLVGQTAPSLRNQLSVVIVSDDDSVPKPVPPDPVILLPFVELPTPGTVHGAR